MSEHDRKSVEAAAVEAGHNKPSSHDGHYDHEGPVTGPVELPSGWMYRKFRLFGGEFWYASPKIQLGMVAFVCFMCPGMFNALSGLGGGGKFDPTLADNMNTALYSTFAVFGFFGGTFVNKLGIKLCLAFGGIGYGLYAISLLVSQHAHVPGFNIFCGVFLGLCAGLLWTAQGAIMISYPQEDQKGHYFAWFWAIFNMGAVLGSLIPLGENYQKKNSSATVGDGTYIGFIVLMFFGAFLALFLVNAKDVVRKDGSKVILMKNPTWQSELYGLYETLRFEPFVLLLFPMFFSSNWFYTYQFNSVNGARFSTRTKSLNSLLYWLAQILAAMSMGLLLDNQKVRRTLRARIAFVFLTIITFAVWGGGYAYQKLYTRESVNPKNGYVPMDWSDDGYVGPMFLYIFYGLFDAYWQATVYWTMGALSNSGRRSANFVGFYKGIQSVGAAIIPNLDARKISYMAEFTSTWALLGASLVFAAPVILMKIKDHVDTEEDLQGTDETIEDVVATAHVDEKGEKHVVAA